MYIYVYICIYIYMYIYIYMCVCVCVCVCVYVYIYTWGYVCHSPPFYPTLRPSAWPSSTTGQSFRATLFLYLCVGCLPLTCVTRTERILLLILPPAGIFPRPSAWPSSTTGPSFRATRSTRTSLCARLSRSRRRTSRASSWSRHAAGVNRYIYLCVYIYIHTYIHTYIYI